MNNFQKSENKVEESEKKNKTSDKGLDFYKLNSFSFYSKLPETSNSESEDTKELSSTE